MRFILILVAVTVLLAGCATDPEAGSGGGDDVAASGGDVAAGELLMASVDRAEPDGADVDALVDGITQFGFELHGHVAEPDRNVVVSPTSIALAFAMARAGAEGATAEQIDTVLHLPTDVATTHASLNALDRLLADIAPGEAGGGAEQATRSADERQPPALEITNGVFPHIGFPIHDDYLETLAAHYGAGVIPVDYTEPDRAKQVIDGWVREQTHDRIDQLFVALPPQTRLVLANAIYLKADWEVPFQEGQTRGLPFTRADGTRVDVPTMQELGAMRYAQGAGWRAVELPYTDGRLAMWVLVPSAELAPSDLLQPDVLTAVGDTLTEGTVDLRLPRWDFQTDLDLKDVMTAMGLQVPFSPDRADFSGITDQHLWIDQAVHRANITVDEWGTEAAAVTGLGFATSGPPAPEIEIHADRPFAFVVLDTQTRTPLFLGQVADPAA